MSFQFNSIENHFEPQISLQQMNFDPLIERIGDSRVVLLGEATHGTSEFYQVRAALTEALIFQKGFNIVALEADWPDIVPLQRYIRHEVPQIPLEWYYDARFPQWMWRNEEFLAFVERLRHLNTLEAATQDLGVHIYGLDLYSLYRSIDEVLAILREVDPQLEKDARSYYACLDPWSQEPSDYGRDVVLHAHADCEKRVVEMLQKLFKERLHHPGNTAIFNAVQNARLIADAEKYYRLMYIGNQLSWNQRDTHMFETLEELLKFHGPNSKAVIWEHNSHVGDASKTQLAKIGEINLGQLCREAFGKGVYTIGFGTDHGSVAAASEWGGPVERKDILPARADSYEGFFHQTGTPLFSLPLRDLPWARYQRQFGTPRLERAIGVIYSPATERWSHYFFADLKPQFDEYIWIDETSAVHPLPDDEGHRLM